MSDNGHLPDSELSVIPGGRLRKDAAGAWLEMRRFVGREKGVWICPTSPRTSYRSLTDQQFFWQLYQSGKGALAARPGTSNHGWGIAVDLPTAPMQAAVRDCGHRFGWGIRGGRLNSDAPSESWHTTFHTGVFEPAASEREHPYQLMNDRERAARDVLVKERRVAQRHGGWSALDASHVERARRAKSELRHCARDIAAAAKKDGWQKCDRKVRFAYINQLTGASK